MSVVGGHSFRPVSLNNGSGMSTSLTDFFFVFFCFFSVGFLLCLKEYGLSSTFCRNTTECIQVLI